LTKMNSSSLREAHINWNNGFIQQEADHSLQILYQKWKYLIDIESNVQYSDCTLFPDNTASKLEVQLREMLNKSQVCGNSLTLQRGDLNSAAVSLLRYSFQLEFKFW
jgi:hypothetical protein